MENNKLNEMELLKGMENEMETLSEIELELLNDDNDDDDEMAYQPLVPPNTAIEYSTHTYDGKLTGYFYKFNRQFHHETKPAITYYHDNGQISTEKYFIHGQRHKENGPAIITYDINGNVESEKYYINNSPVQMNKYKNKNITCENIKRFIQSRKKLNSLLELKLVINMFIKSEDEKIELFELLQSKLLMMKLTNNSLEVI